LMTVMAKSELNESVIKPNKKRWDTIELCKH
jgi:hypothetical protein